MPTTVVPSPIGLKSMMDVAHRLVNSYTKRENDRKKKNRNKKTCLSKHKSNAEEKNNVGHDKRQSLLSTLSTAFGCFIAFGIPCI